LWIVGDEDVSAKVHVSGGVDEVHQVPCKCSGTKCHNVFPLIFCGL
jgi:hypothetical protein